MGASALPGVGVGLGQPTRHDFVGQAHQERLQPGARVEVPKTGVDPTRDRPAEDRGDPRSDGRSGWARQEAFVASNGAADAGTDWNQFSGQPTARGWGGAQQVEIDAPSFRPKDLGIQQDPKAWAEQAARLEEFFRAEGEQVGIDAELKLPGEGPTAKAATESGGGSRRRAFTLKTT